MAQRNDMSGIVLLVAGLWLIFQTVAAVAQTANPPPFQSLQPTQSPCSAGSQSVRVCNDDFRSCNSICTARALDPSADIAGCSTRCCNQFNACLRLRGCGPRTVNCF
jgi:hypothetical protein